MFPLGKSRALLIEMRRALVLSRSKETLGYRVAVECPSAHT
jgi:hypothetical protein